MVTEKLFYKISIANQKGQIIKKGRFKLSRSFVLQYLQVEEILMAHTYNVVPDQINVKDTANANQLLPRLTSNWLTVTPSTEAPATIDTYGIQVGRDNTGLANTNYTLVLKVTHGIGANQMQYGACGVGTAAVNGANVDLVITRAFVNSSGNTITLLETGIVAAIMNSGAAQCYFLFVRDTVNQAVLNTETATVTYLRRTTA